MQTVVLPIQYKLKDQNAHSVLLHFASEYTDPVRSTLLGAKIGKSQQCLDQVLQSTTSSYLSTPIKTTFDYVVPAPSSLWSRLHGRWDVAAMIAKEMSEQLSLPMRAPPLSQCWRWTKSSHTPKHQIRESHYQLNASKFRAHALVVDDVATTGTTLTELALYLLRKNIYVEALVYAKAGRHLGHICK